jgi:hypothetical protein
MRHTVIAVFDDVDQAQRAVNSLKQQGFESVSVSSVEHAAKAPEIQPLPAAVEMEGGPAGGLLHRLAALFGVEEPHVAHYNEAVRRGGCIVNVEAADEAQATSARDALLALGAVNIEDRLDVWRQTGWDEPDSASRRGGEPLAATSSKSGGVPLGFVVHREELSLGGVRVYGRTVVRMFDDSADEFRSHCADHYAAEGGSYADYEPAYRFGHALATEAPQDRREWNDIEVDARARWEQDQPQSRWERYQHAVRHAWERARDAM